jgi:hypothetical protein
MFPRLIAGLVLAAAAFAGVPQTPAPLGSPFAGVMVDLAPPVPAGATLPNIASDGNGRIWLSWIEPREGGGYRFRLSMVQARAAATATSWSIPVTLAEGPNLLANWADFPSVFVARDGTLAVHWLERGSNRGEYGIRVRTSMDDGHTWTDPVTPHQDPPASVEHGFVSFFDTLVPDAKGGGIGLVWLDGREMGGPHMAEGKGGSMTLRSAMVPRGKLGREMLVDAKVCECCQTSAARTDDGVVVAYRDRSDTNIRDIAVARLQNGKWTSAIVAHDNWQLDGCPVNGPSVAAIGNNVAVAWFSAKDSAPKVQVAFSKRDGTFNAPIRVDSAISNGRVAIVMPSDDRVLVSSNERGAAGAQLVIREARRDGRTGDPIAIGPMTADRSSGFARMTLAGRKLVVAWTDVRPGTPPAIRMRAADLR